MNESEFNRLVDRTMAAIEDAIDDSGADIDFDQQGGVLTLSFENGSKLIFSRQPPLKQLWLAAPAGGFHFDWVDGEWQLPDGRALNTLVNQFASDLAGEALQLEF